MNIKITRKDGGLQINPAPPYVTKYLKYQHRSMEIVKYKRVPVFTERLLHASDPDGSIYTLPGYFEKICKLIHKNSDTFHVEDFRTPMPAIDWAAVKAVGLRDYQIDHVVSGLKKGMENSCCQHYGLPPFCMAWLDAGCQHAFFHDRRGKENGG